MSVTIYNTILRGKNDIWTKSNAAKNVNCKCHVYYETRIRIQKRK